MTQAFNLSQLANKVNSSGQLDVATGVTGTQAVANGGTGQTTYTNGQLLIGNTTGNTLTKSTLTAGAGVTITNGAGSITIGAASGQIQTQLFTAPGTWSNPGTVTQVRVTVVGGGGGGGGNQRGGIGGLAIAVTPVSAPVNVTVGAGGASNSGSGSSGGTSSFGPAVSATGGTGAPGPVAGTNGSGTVSIGTAFKTTNCFNGATGVLLGAVAPPTPTSFPSPGAAFTYSTSSPQMAGASGGANNSGPYLIGACSGAVVVEWVS